MHRHRARVPGRTDRDSLRSARGGALRSSAGAAPAAPPPPLAPAVGTHTGRMKGKGLLSWRLRLQTSGIYRASAIPDWMAKPEPASIGLLRLMVWPRSRRSGSIPGEPCPPLRSDSGYDNLTNRTDHVLLKAD